MTTGPLAAVDQQTHIYPTKQNQDGHVEPGRACVARTGMCSEKGLHPLSESALLKVMLPATAKAETGIASLRSTIWNV